MSTVKVTDETFEKDVLQAEAPVLVDFWAEWCGPCKQIAPALEQISDRIDRLVVLADRVLVADFKTNRPSPSRIEDADPAYLRQMAVYAAVLADIFPTRRIEAALIWTDGPKLMAVPEILMAESLADLGRGG